MGTHHTNAGRCLLQILTGKFCRQAPNPLAPPGQHTGILCDMDTAPLGDCHCDNGIPWYTPGTVVTTTRYAWYHTTAIARGTCGMRGMRGTVVITTRIA
jgi:hypothetical protein